ncbi:MAG: right-handed parallel beta-helix repeat-containing protein [Candidatus Cloacimonetes bacterium]|nr:right-handed parallel beta-helix repeat-containing protein [Candidatus Cloacimonadota bacterium]
MVNRTIFILFFIISFFYASWADTIHDSNITVNETWDPGGNPHIVQSTLNVSSGITLTVAAGCEVRFNVNTALNIYGNISAPGTVGNTISFELNAESGTWLNIYFTVGGEGSFSYCTFQNANRALYSYNADQVTADHCNFYNCSSYGAWIRNTGLSFTDCVFQNNTTGLSVDNCTAPTVGANNNFSGNTTGLHISDSSDPTIALQQPVSGNTSGIYLENCSDPVLAAGNSFIDNTSYGLAFEDCSGLGTLDNLIFTGNGDFGALLVKNSGDFLLGSGNTISGNEWPLTINCGSFPHASSFIPATGNTNNNIRVTSGTGTNSGTWPHFTDLVYIVTDSPTIQAGGSLTIADGNTLKFDASKQISVYGVLNAPGTSGAGILFTKAGDNSWQYIAFTSGGQGSFSYCSFEHSVRAIYGINTTLITASHCSFDQNSYGSWLQNTALDYTDCVFQNNNQIALYIKSCTSPVLGAGNSFSGNNYGIHIHDSTDPYVDLQSLIYDNDYGVIFENCSNPVLAADNSITDNDFCGLQFKNCSGLGTLDHLTFTGNTGYGAMLIKNSGNFKLGPDIINTGNHWPLTIDTGSFPEPTSTIPTSGNLHNDIRVTSGSSDKIGTWPDFADLDYVVTESPTIQAAGSLTIADGNTIRFNLNKEITVYGILNAAGAARNGINFTNNNDGDSWYDLHFATASQGSFSYCTFENSWRGLYGYNSGTITVDHCIFHDNEKGSWMQNADFNYTSCEFYENETGLYVVECSSPVIGVGNNFHDNTLALHIDTSTDPFISLLEPVSGNSAGIKIEDCASPIIDADNIISNNTEYGIWFLNCSGLGILDELTLTGNGNYGALLVQNSGDFLLGPANDISGNNWPLTINCGSFPDLASTIPGTGNTNNDIRVTSGTSDKSGIWPDFIDLDYVVTESPTIAATATLTIADGNTIRFDINQEITIYGTFKATGAARNGIDFIRNGASGTWYNLHFVTTGQGNLSYCTVENSLRGLYGYNASIVIVDHCIFHDNDRGSWLSQSNWVFTACTFQNNNDGIFIDDSSPAIHNCTITDNSENGIKIQGTSVPNLGNNVGEGNDIYNNGIYNIYNGEENVSALYTYWGRDYPAGIEYTIYDFYDNSNLGIVEFEPWSNSSHTLMLSLGTPPSDLFIHYDTGNIVLDWTASPDATYYVVLSSPVPYIANHLWQEAATGIYTNSWSKTPALVKEYYAVVSIIAE